VQEIAFCDSLWLFFVTYSLHRRERIVPLALTFPWGQEAKHRTPRKQFLWVVSFPFEMALPSAGVAFFHCWNLLPPLAPSFAFRCRFFLFLPYFHVASVFGVARGQNKWVQEELAGCNHSCVDVAYVRT
jgi:hypothetical protein